MRKEIKILILVILIFQTTDAFIFDLLTPILSPITSLLDPFGLFSGGIGGGGGSRGPTQQQSQPEPKKTIRDAANIPLLARLGRSMDGSGNNQNNPSFGRSFVSMPRLTKAAYTDNKAGMINRGNPRQLSNIIGAINNNEPIKQNRMGLTMLFVLFGQFMDHDLDLTFPSFTQKVLIKVPKGDPWFDKKKQGNKTIEFSRSKFVDRNGERIFLNQLTSWIDGSQMYGSTADQNKPLRQFKGGKLKLPNNMLPKDSTGAYIAGDVRVNQNIGLTSIQTVFARQHNRQCGIIVSKFPHLNDEEVFQMARNKIAGFIQKIAFKEYLPLLLGQEAYARFIGNYRGYDSNVRPDINLQFSGAAYRIGHPLLFDQIDAYDYSNRRNRTFKMQEMFMSFEVLNKQQQVDFIMNGLTRSPAKQRNNQIVDGLRNMLRQFPGFVQDLFALNIQRGRDHGLPDYNTVRSLLGLNKFKSFSELSSNQETVRRLNTAYNNNINLCDLWVGIISEQPVSGGNLGLVGSAIVGETFRRIRDGDRLWYQNAYPREDINQIQSTTFRDIILRNTKLSNLPAGFIMPGFKPQFDIERDFATVNSFGQANSNNLVGDGVFNQGFISNNRFNSDANFGINAGQIPLSPINSGTNAGVSFNPPSGLISSLSNLNNIGQNAGLTLNSNSAQSSNVLNTGINTNQNLVLSSGANSGLESGTGSGVNLQPASGLFSSLNNLNNLGKSAGINIDQSQNSDTSISFVDLPGTLTTADINAVQNTGLNNINSQTSTNTRLSGSGGTGQFNVLDSFVTGVNNLRTNTVRQP